MNPFQIDLGALLIACRKALLGRADWVEGVDLSRRGFWQSFAALGLCVPALYVCAIAIARQRARIFDMPESLVSPLIFAVVALIYLLTFSATAYIICAAFSKQNRFRPWVILRHWSVFFIVLLTASLYGLNILGVLPFEIANFAALGLYLSVLAVDIRLAHIIGGFDITPAIFTACIIFGMGLSVLLIGVAQIGAAG